tara:strand:- start:3613 stop:5736 length:2124 start_codon:yes stop_codon:yes gene_type:complete
MSKLRRYNWKGYNTPVSDLESSINSSNSNFVKFLELKQMAFNDIANNDYIHTDFKHDDEINIVNKSHIDFTNDIGQKQLDVKIQQDNKEQNDESFDVYKKSYIEADSHIIIDKCSNISSISKLNNIVSKIWHKSLIFSYYCSNIERQWDKVENMQNPFYIALNILRQIQVEENSVKLAHYATIPNDLDELDEINEIDKLFKIFPLPEGFPILEPMLVEQPFNTCKDTLDPWLSKILDNIADKLKFSDDLWNNVYEEMLTLINFSLFVSAPILYQMYGKNIIIGTMNHKLVVFSNLFNVQKNAKIKASSAIQKIWNSHSSDEHAYYYFVDEDSPNTDKKRLTLLLPPNIYYEDNEIFNVKNLLEYPEERQRLKSKFIYKKAYDTINSIEKEAFTYIENKNSINYSIKCKKNYLEFINNQLENIKNIRLFLELDENNQYKCLNNKKNPLDLILSIEFSDFENNINNTLEPCCGFDNLKMVFLNFDNIKLRFKHIIERCSYKEAKLNSLAKKVRISSKDNIFPTIYLITNNQKSTVEGTITRFAYDLLSLYSPGFQSPSIRFLRGNIIIGETYKQDYDTPDFKDTKGNKVAHQFIEKLKNISQFITFVRLSKLYNPLHYKELMDSIKNNSIFITNDAIYDVEPIDVQIFKDIIKIVNPPKNTKIQISKLIQTVKISLELSITDKTYGLMRLHWFSSQINKFLLSLDEIIE